MSNQKIAESLGMDFQLPDEFFDKLPTVRQQPNVEMDEDDADLLDDFEIARAALKNTIEATDTATKALAILTKTLSQDTEMYDALSKMSSTTVNAATALVNLHRIKKQIGVIGNKGNAKGDNTIIAGGDVTMVGTMGDILDKVTTKTIEHS